MMREVTKAGDQALMVELGSVTAEVLHAAAMTVRSLSGVLACIAGQQSLLVVFGREPDRDAVQEAVANAVPRAIAGAAHELRVHFETPHALDLDELLARTGLTKHRFLSEIANVTLTARYLGFRAGFAYLEGWPEAWSLPRRATSRNRIPRGSFAIAGTMAGFYPLDSPGGWNVLGRTAAPLWDARRNPPNLIAPGDRVRIVPASEPFAIAPNESEKRTEGRPANPVAEVVGPGQLTSIVGPRDWSRAEVGVPPGGPFDDEMMARANRSVGNPPFAPALECVLVGPRLRFLRASTIAWCAGSQTLRRNVSAGEELDLGRIEGSFRGYLAIKGGFRDPRPLFGESPVVLRAGDRLGATDVADFGLFEESGSESSSEDRLTIRILTGPHDAPPLPEEWIVSSQLNRVGIRLTPAAPSAVSLPADLPSCGMQFGTLQWHPDGSLLAMGPDHPVTGGYLQPATVLRGDLWKLGQLAPGDRVRLVAG